MRVENLLGENFDKACRQLAAKGLAQMQPDMIIGIRRGGLWVTEAMKSLPELQAHLSESQLHFGETGLQRKGTAEKNRLSKILQSLPQWLCNALRIIESICLRMQHACRRPQFFPLDKIVFDAESERRLQNKAQHIWIVDDAVDSGRSMASIQAKLQTYPQAHKVLYLALTVTEKQPLLMPDCYLYHEGVLLRFPWSNDVKQTK